MIKVNVSNSRSYDIIIQKGCINEISEFLNSLSLGNKIMIVSDDTVAALYLNLLKNKLENAGYKCYMFVFSHGESSKNASTYLSLVDALAECHFSRKDTILALGGGVVGDLAGFAAATYMRGIRYISVPTTLLSMVDSSVGGKTAVDIAAGKNLLGAFWQPSLVIIDPDLLSTLPEEYFSDGMAEVIKYAMIKDESIFSLIDGGRAKENIEELIAACVRAKRDVVCEDEFEGGVRAILNFGHTPAHAIEKESEYRISHGRAVAMGMKIMTKASYLRGKCGLSTLQKLNEVLSEYSLSELCPYSGEVLSKIALSDKKASGDEILLVYTSGTGKALIEKTPLCEIEKIFDDGLGE